MPVWLLISFFSRFVKLQCFLKIFCIRIPDNITTIPDSSGSGEMEVLYKNDTKTPVPWCLWQDMFVNLVGMELFYTLQPGSTDTQSCVPHAGFPLFKPDKFVFPFSQTDGFSMFKGMNAMAGFYPFNQVNLAGIF